MGSPASSLEGRRRTQFAGGPYAKRVVELDVLAGLEPGLFEQRERLELHYARAIARAPEPECPSTDGWWAISDSSGLAVPRLCKRWTCPSCVRLKRAAALVSIQDGLCAAAERGSRVRFMTLTDGGGDMDFAAFYAAWSRKLRPRLRRRAKLGDYACALEVQPQSGRLHGHFLLIDSAKGGGFIAQAELSRLAEACGFGRIVDIREVTDIPRREQRLSAYFTKGTYRVATEEAGVVAAYMAKVSRVSQLGELAATRIRPFRVSAGWPLKLTEAQRRLVEEWYGGGEDDGPWRLVDEGHAGRFLLAEREHQRERSAGRISLGSKKRQALLLAGEGG